MQHDLDSTECTSNYGVISAHPWPDGSSEGFWQALEDYQSIRNVRWRNALATNPQDFRFNDIDDSAQE